MQLEIIHRHHPLKFVTFGTIGLFALANPKLLAIWNWKRWSLL